MFLAELLREFKFPGRAERLSEFIFLCRTMTIQLHDLQAEFVTASAMCNVAR